MERLTPKSFQRITAAGGVKTTIAANQRRYKQSINANKHFGY